MTAPLPWMIKNIGGAQNAYIVPTGWPGPGGSLAQLQAQPRTGRTPAATIQPIITQQTIDDKIDRTLTLKVLEDMRSQMDKALRDRMRAMFIDPLLNDPGKGIMARNHLQRDPPVNYEDLVRAQIERWREDVDMSMILLRPHDTDPVFVESWIWGPLREFTAFPLPEAIRDELIKGRIGHAHSGEVFDNVGFDRGVGGENRLRFRVTVLIGIRELSQRYMTRRAGSPYAPPSPVVLVQFQSYDDYALMETIARNSAAPSRYEHEMRHGY